MKKLFSSKKRIAVAAAGVVAIVGTSMAAFAYFTGTGTGTGSATTAGAPTALTVNGPATIGALGPGLDPITLSGSFDNPNSEAVHVGSVTVAISGITGNSGACSVSDYALVQPAAVNAEIPNGNNQGSWGGGSIGFNDSPTTDQSGCEGATVNLSYTITP